MISGEKNYSLISTLGHLQENIFFANHIANYEKDCQMVLENKVYSSIFMYTTIASINQAHLYIVCL